MQSPSVPGIRGEWQDFGPLLAADLRSENPVVRKAAETALNALLDYINAKIG